MPEEENYEPGLLTHDSTYGDPDGYDDFGGFDEYADGDPADDEASHNESAGKGRKAALTPKQRKRRRWRIIRRTLYAFFAVFFVLPAVAFTITYFIVEVPSPEQVAASQGQVVTYYYSNGEVMGKVAPTKTGNRVILQPHQIPEVVKHAVYAAEDAGFESNPGFDITGIARAAWGQLTGDPAGGGSTISQQYIKQATGYDDHTYVRKFIEIVKAFKMNNQQSKSQIITAYLNTIYLGRGAYGIQTAAQAYFGKDVGELKPSEAALLAGMIQQPSRYDDMEYMKYRWNYVMDQMVANNWLSPKKRKAAEFPDMLPLSTIGGKGFSGSKVYIKQRVNAELAAKGYSEKQLQSGGYKVYTTIDQRAQKLAKQAVHKVMKDEPTELREGFVAVDPNNGAVRAYYGGPHTKQGGFQDGANVLRNPGSSYKPFVLVALLKEGKGLSATYNGTDSQMIAGVKRRNAGPNSSCSATCTVAMGMKVSANTVFFNILANDLTVQQVIDAAHAAGIPLKWGGERTMGKGDVNIAIGGGDTQVSTTMMAEAFATFASGGIRHDAHFVSKLVNSEGDVVYKANTEGEAAFAATRAKSKQIAANVTKSLKPVLEHAHLSCPAGYHCAAKTGTQGTVGNQHANSQAWTVGYTPTISAAAWVGTFGGPKEEIYNSNGNPIYGADQPGAIWEAFMQSYLPGTPQKRFPGFPNVDLIGGPIHQYDQTTRQRNPGARQEETENTESESSTTTTESSTSSSENTQSNDESTSNNEDSSSNNNGENNGGSNEGNGENNGGGDAGNDGNPGEGSGNQNQGQPWPPGRESPLGLQQPQSQ